MSLTWHIDVFVERAAPLAPAERQALIDHVEEKRGRLGRHGYRFEIADGGRDDQLVARGVLDMPWSLNHKDLPAALEALGELRGLLPGVTLRVQDTLGAIHWSSAQRVFVLDGPRSQAVPRYQTGGSWIPARRPPAVPGVAPGAPADEVVRVAWSQFHSLAQTPAWDAVRACEASVTDWTPVAIQFVALWREARRDTQRWMLGEAASDGLCAHPLVEELVAGELAAGRRRAVALAFRCRGPGSLVGLARLAPESVHRRGDPASLPTTLLQLARGRTYMADEVAGVLGDDAVRWLCAAALEYGPRAVARSAGTIADPAVLPLLEELVRLPDLRDQALRVLLIRDPARGVAALEWLMSGDRGGLMARAVVGELLKEAKHSELAALSAEIAALRDQDEAIRARLESWSAARGGRRWQGESVATPAEWIEAARPRLAPLAMEIDAALIADLERREAEWMASVPIAAPPRAEKEPIQPAPAIVIGAWLASGEPDRKETARAVRVASRARDDASLAALIELARRDRDAAERETLRMIAVKALAARADARARATLCLEIACAATGSYRHAIDAAAGGLAAILGAGALPWVARAALGANSELLVKMVAAAARLPAAEAQPMLRLLARFIDATDAARRALAAFGPVPNIPDPCRSAVGWRAAVEGELGPIAARAATSVAALSGDESAALVALRAGQTG